MPDHVIISVIESDVPAGLTLVQWRRDRIQTQARRRRPRLRVRPVLRPAFA